MPGSKPPRAADACRPTYINASSVPPRAGPALPFFSPFFLGEACPVSISPSSRRHPGRTGLSGHKTSTSHHLPPEPPFSASKIPPPPEDDFRRQGHVAPTSVPPAELPFDPGRASSPFTKVRVPLSRQRRWVPEASESSARDRWLLGARGQQAWDLVIPERERETTTASKVETSVAAMVWRSLELLLRDLLAGHDTRSRLFPAVNVHAWKGGGGGIDSPSASGLVATLRRRPELAIARIQSLGRRVWKSALCVFCQTSRTGATGKVGREGSDGRRESAR